MATRSDIVNLTHDHETRGKVRKASSKDMLSSTDAHVARIKLAIGEIQDKFDDTEERIERLDSKREELREEMQGILNEFMDLLTQKNESLEAMMVAMREEMDELTACKTAIRGDVLAMTLIHQVDVPKPKEFEGTRSIKEVDNFLWGMERYFRASNITVDATKVSTASMYLIGIALLWWRRRCDNEKHGGAAIDT